MEGEGKIVKKFILPMLALLVSLVLVTPAFASAKNVQNLEKLTQNKGKIIYQDDEITVRSFGNDQKISDAIFNDPNSVVADNSNSVIANNNQITPFSSVVGPGGRASIVAGTSGRIVYWTVKPATLWPYNFEGAVNLKYYSGYSRIAPIGGMGALGSSVSGEVTMNKNNGGVAYLTGTAYSLNGSQYTVLPGVHTAF